MSRLFFTILLLISLGILPSVYSQVPDWIWAKNGVSIDDDWNRAIAVDENGNAVVAGAFFDGQVNAGIFWAIGNGLIDSYICKYDNTGQYVFAIV